MVHYRMGDVDPNHILHVNLQLSYSFIILTQDSRDLVLTLFFSWINTRVRISRHPKSILMRSAQQKRPFVVLNDVHRFAESLNQIVTQQVHVPKRTKLINSFPFSTSFQRGRP